MELPFLSWLVNALAAMRLLTEIQIMEHL